MGKRLLGTSFPQAAIDTIAPVADVGIDMMLFDGQSKARWWLITAVVTVAPSNLTVWGALAQGVAEDATDDIWGKYQDPHGTFPLGLIATALPIGTYHFLVEGLGIYSRTYFQGSAGNVDITLTEVHEAERGS